MDSSSIDARTQMPQQVRQQMPENPALRLLLLVPTLGMVAVGVTTYKTLIPPEARALSVAQEQYGKPLVGIEDVNDDGEFEPVFKYTNRNTGQLERRILHFRNGDPAQPVLSRYEVQEGKIVYLD